jgi:predicted nucleic acid-binding Zn ribbon protein
MIYEYNCNTCGLTEINKPMTQSSRDEFCGCGEKLNRIFGAPQVLVQGRIFDYMNSQDQWGYIQDKKRIEKEFKENKAKGIEPASVKLPMGMSEALKPELK